ncbi:MAG: asparagine synthase (glutamine-hydrolyzing) [Acidobacteria bacterium]|jgi:asparagine synthase (glutamine-hydrolysing)|nr:asparagine synthase (glutamine-hydrolyzing) [Acidobacteriota bacterium]
MCGIVAIVTPEAWGQSAATVTRMVSALRHRGPDSQGLHDFGRCVLGSARLSIVDVDGGDQPILSADAQTGVTFNGAIYGFRQLKAALSDFPFKTGTDTEVILALHAKHGDGFLSHLPGMFAFALWDGPRQTLTCARDRFGEKPLYFAQGSQGEFVVASEIKALLASGLVEPVLSRQALSHYIQRLHVHPTQTIYANVHVLPPAHMLRFHNGRLEVARYWEPPDVTEGMTMPDAVERFRELFDAAVQKQLVADVPVGVFLSGGVDSSTVAAVASRHTQGLKTFSFGFRQGVENELPFARGMAARYGTHHFELADEDVDVSALLWRMQDIYDEPFGDSSNIPTFLISEFARRHVTVALGGDGADELLGGYLCWSRHLLNAPAGTSPLVYRYAHADRVYFTPEQQRQLGHTGETDSLIDYRRYRTGTVGDMLRFDMELYLPGDVLVKTDRASMASSLELRAPFLDVDVASFCLSLPDHLKVDDAREKLLLREAYGSSWTPEIRTRAKQGFGGPMSEWLASPELAEMKREYLGDRNQSIFGVLDFNGVQPFVESNNQQTWSLLVLALWMSRHPCSLPAN